MLKKYNQFIKESDHSILKKMMWSNVLEICKEYEIQNWTINSDEAVDVDGSVWLEEKGLTELPLKFGKVRGNFKCSDNKLTSLKGSPDKLGGGFDCSNNNLTTLEGCTNDIVVGNFQCYYNKLTSLKGAPDKVTNHFDCENNNLISFKYLPLANSYSFWGNPIYEFLQHLAHHYQDGKNLGLYLRLFEDIVQFPYLDDLEFEELAKSLKVELPENWRDSVKSYKMLSKF